MPRAAPVVHLEPVTEQGLVELIVRHQLQDVDLPAPTTDGDDVLAAWLTHLSSPAGGAHRVRLLLDGSGAPWLVLRDAAGLLRAGNVGGVLRQMTRDRIAGRRYEGGSGRAGLREFLAAERARLAERS